MGNDLDIITIMITPPQKNTCFFSEGGDLFGKFINDYFFGILEDDNEAAVLRL